MAKGKTRFAPELSKEEELQLIESAIPGITKKATKYGIKIFQGNKLLASFYQAKHLRWL